MDVVLGNAITSRMFSVPDNVMHSAMQGSSQWWYQPAHEPGNILSYPIDKSQLQLEYQNSQIAPLTQEEKAAIKEGRIPER